MGEDRIKRFVNFCLRYLADLDIPKKRLGFEYVAAKIGPHILCKNAILLLNTWSLAKFHQKWLRENTSFL